MSRQEKRVRRKKVGLIISFFAAIAYLINYFWFAQYWDTGIGCLIIGLISIGGVILGLTYKIKLGGAAILLSFPISIILALIFFGFSLYDEIIFNTLLSSVYPVPGLVLLIIGGIVCLASSDKK